MTRVLLERLRPTAVSDTVSLLDGNCLAGCAQVVYRVLYVV